MSWMEFIADVVGSLAWPAALAFIVFLLRGQLRRLLADLRALRYRGAEAEFGRSLQEAEDEAEQAALPPAAPDEGDQPDDRPGLERSARADPRSVVIDAYLDLEDELDHFAMRVGEYEEGMTWRSARELAHRLAKLGRLPPSLVAVIEELQRSRNVAVHSPSATVDPEQAVDYVRLVERVKRSLRDLARLAERDPEVLARQASLRPDDPDEPPSRVRRRSG